MLKNNMRIDGICISDKFCDLVTAQSCDCKEILLKSGDLSYLISHRVEGDEGYIEIKCEDDFNSENFTYAVDLTDLEFYFDRIQALDSGRIEGVRFRSKKMFLFIFALEYNLVLTQTTYDLFDETETDIPGEKDEPLLRIKSKI